MDRLIPILEGFGSPEVLLVGDFMLDEYVYGDAERISPEAPVPVLRVVRREFRCGGSASAALAMTALGARVRAVGVLGNDESGEQLRSLLRASGVDTDGLIACDDRPTVLKRRYVGLAQHRHQQQILRVDEESPHPLDAATHRAIRERIEASLGAVDALAIEDYDKGVVGDYLPECIAAARKSDLPVVVDPACLGGEPYARRYRGATLLTPNRYEAEVVAGVRIDSEASAEQAAEGVIARADASAVVITLDKQGAYLKQAGRDGRMIPTRPRSVYDVSGAGDVVMAMLTVAVASGCPLEEATALANVAGGLEVERFGVVPVTREEIVAELRTMVGLRRSKVMDRPTLAAELERRRRGGATVVLTNGCFDLMHLGHVTYLQQAREMGTCLVVAINSDESVARLKGPDRPIIDQEERARMLAALECVDYVTIFDEDTPEALLDLLKPEILVKGGTTGHIVGGEIVEGYGGRVERLGLVEGLSTTAIIERIQNGGR